MSRARRWLARRAARRGRWFWLPCPVCQEPFGGQEWREVDGLPGSVPEARPGFGILICPACTAAGYGYPLDVEMEIWRAGAAS